MGQSNNKWMTSTETRIDKALTDLEASKFHMIISILSSFYYFELLLTLCTNQVNSFFNLLLYYDNRLYQIYCKKALDNEFIDRLID